MKTIANAAVQSTGSISQPLPKSVPTGARPVRRGHFWPGENFTGNTPHWNLLGAFAEHAFVLPALASKCGPQTH